MSKIGKKLYIGQHGGNLGACLWSQREDHQLKICDKYFSWGWKREGYKHIKHISASNLIKVKKTIKPNIDGDVLSVLASFPRYFFCSFSMPKAGQFIEYIEFQKKLINLLNPKLRKKFKMRLETIDY